VYWNGYAGYGLRKFGNTWLSMDGENREQCADTDACIIPIDYFMKQRRRTVRDELRSLGLWREN
jgi:hypothetical protein